MRSLKSELKERQRPTSFPRTAWASIFLAPHPLDPLRARPAQTTFSAWDSLTARVSIEVFSTLSRGDQRHNERSKRKRIIPDLKDSPSVLYVMCPRYKLRTPQAVRAARLHPLCGVQHPVYQGVKGRFRIVDIVHGRYTPQGAALHGITGRFRRFLGRVAQGAAAYCI